MFCYSISNKPKLIQEKEHNNYVLLLSIYYFHCPIKYPPRNNY